MKVLGSKKFSSSEIKKIKKEKKIATTLLVTCLMIIKIIKL